MLFLVIDEFDHHLGLRPFSVWAKKAADLRIISLACLSSRFSRSNSAMLAAWLHLGAIAWIAAQSEG